MSSLQPIRDVINSFTPAQEDPLLTWEGEDSNGYWLLRRPDGDQIDLRVKEYLAHIQVLWAWNEDGEERALWPILIAWFGKDEPLLPNLRDLIIRFTDGFASSYQCLAFMVTPGLEVISTGGIQCSEDLIPFCQLLHSRGCSPTDVEYTGDVRLPPTLTFFKNVNSLNVSGPYKHTKHSSPYSLLQLLQRLPSLRVLEIDLQALRIQTRNPLDPFEHLSLEELTLKGTTKELQPFLSFDITCLLVKLFSLKILYNTNLSWKFLFNKVTSIFPNVCNLTIKVVEIADTHQLVLSDLAKFLSQPIESLILDDVPNKLTWKDLHRMLERWPGLHTLTLTGGKISFKMDAVLSTFTYRKLHTLHLPLNLTPLASPLTGDSATQRNPLRHLHVAPPTNFPSTFKEKITLAQNLLTLLPELEAVNVDDKRLGAGATDLQDILSGMEAVVAVRSGQESMGCRNTYEAVQYACCARK